MTSLTAPPNASAGSGSPLARFWRRLTRLRPIHFSFCAGLVLALQGLLLLLYQFRFPGLQLRDRGELLLCAAVGAVMVLAHFQLLGLLLGRWRTALRLGNLLSVAAFLFLLVYHYYFGARPDYSLLGENAVQIFRSQTLRIIGTYLSGLKFVLMLLAVGGLLVLAFGTRLMAAPPRPQYYRATLAATGAVWLLLFVLPAYAQSDLAYFVRTAYDYARCSRLVEGPATPLIHRVAHPRPLSEQNPARPHVFIVMVESFNAHFAGERTPEGQDYTPAFNAFARRGFHVERFYGNSIQTTRGQLAVLASILPSFHGKVAEDFPGLRLKALPEILRRRGYRTVFFQSYADLAFDNAGPFMRHLGFETVKAMNEEFLTPADQPDVWGWGLQDDAFFRKFFGWLDGEHARAAAAGADPRYFCTLATISSHIPFDQMPAAKRELYPDPADQRQHYANVIHLADRGLGVFLAQLAAREYLKNSVVVITGDHSFPAGEHGLFFSGASAYEENFRTPLALAWPGHLEPREVREVAYSQLDIAPTLLDLLEIQEDHHFLGRSMLAGDAVPQAPIGLVQPYSGLYLGVVQYPLKYVRQFRDEQEVLFDLSRDPQEQQNLIQQYEGRAELAALRGRLELILENQRRIERDQVWPASEP